ncbi:HalOD1 output domain-containing protein [Natrinema gelatinilyticum]|uniref:HalOD1 output domain-containing protein n=1 Tax=Natrinema gelatinilyticum TaxID=2961571 RepID=UPI0020C3F14D|nr:HalOD1 output domain-containing protein [Natrinema gelatinilyticum]
MATKIPRELPDEDEPISANVIDAIATAMETDPLELSPPLYYSIDLAALDRLFRTKSPTTVRFDYNGRDVTVQGDGTVSVGDPPPDRA